MRVQSLEAEVKYRSLMETAADAILLLNSKGRVLEANQAAADMSGYDLDGLIGLRLTKLLPEDAHAWRREQAAHVDKLNQVTGMTGTARRRDGSEFPFEASVNKLQLAGQGVYQIVARDITQRKQFEEQALEAERLKALGQIAGGVAHDFNNLLTAILGRVQLLLMNAPDAQGQRALKTIEKAALDGSETVKRIQRFAQPAVAGEEFVPVEVNSVVKDAIDTTRYRWRDEAQRDGVLIRLESNLAPVPTIMGNPAELRHIVANLILNACDAMPAGGEIAVGTHTDGATVTVTISDSGVGITSEDQQHIFESFFTTKKGENMGMGLSLARDIVHRHGGDLVVDSTVNEGTTFTLTVPRSDEAVPLPAEATMPESNGHARVLVVDDEPVLCQLLVEMLEALGHQAVAANTSEEAFQLLNTYDHNVVITDLAMPNISGWEVAKAAKQRDPQTYTILLTGWDDPIGKHARPQIDQMLNKPVTIVTLATAIHTGLERRSE